MSKIYNRENYEDIKEGEILRDNFLKTKWRVIRLIPGGAVLRDISDQKGRIIEATKETCGMIFETITGIYKKLNDEPIIVADEIDEETGTMYPAFYWNGKLYDINDFLKVTNNPYASKDFPDYIHAYETSEYKEPYFIEFLGDSEINIYEQTIK